VFDFRYHALSLVAVFLALTIGLLLGVAIGDQELVSSAREDVRGSLRDDVKEANDEAEGLRAELDERQRFERAVYPLLVGGQLQDRNIGLVFLGDPSEETIELVREALEPAGAELELVAALRQPIDLAALADLADPTRYTGLGEEPELVEPFGRRVGEQLVRGGQLVRDVRPALLRSFSGSVGDLDGVVVVRSATDADDEDQQAVLDTLHDAIARGLADTGVPVVGTERTDSDPSQIGWYRDRGLTSVDHLDTVAGRAALIFTLAGAEGAFGVKDEAQALLPPVVGGVAAPD
jgi:hypothetical protein